jgi:hypothetical protein
MHPKGNARCAPVREKLMPLRFALATLGAAALFALPSVAGAAVAEPAGPVPKAVTPMVKGAVPTSSPSPAAKPSAAEHQPGPSIMLRPDRGSQFTLYAITESSAPPPGKAKGCLLFTVTAALNTTDAVTILNLYNQSTIINEAIITDGGVSYDLSTASISSYRASSSSATFVLTPLKYTVHSGGQQTSEDCQPTTK